MSTNLKIETAYGFTSPLLDNSPDPIVSKRNPTTADKAQLGTTWVNKTNDTAYILTSIVNNSANWEAVGGGGGGGITQIDGDAGSAVPAAGIVDIDGGLNINTSGAGNTLTVNLNNDVSITGDYTTTTGNIILPVANVAGTEGMIKTNDGASNLIYAAPGTTNNNYFIGSSGNTTTSANGDNNIGIGFEVLLSIDAGTDNVCIGTSAGSSLSGGSVNVAIGSNAMTFAGNATSNVAIGNGALGSFAGGSNNIAIGNSAANSFSGNESDNIIIGSTGTAGDTTLIRLGNPLTINQCFIGGISGITVTGAAVLCSTTGKLGTVVSSEKFKENIRDISNTSEAILSLRPVVFNYKKDDSRRDTFGLIAEEVHDVFPDIVLYDDNKEPLSVAYHELPVLLLNELKKSNDRISVLENMLADVLQKLI